MLRLILDHGLSYKWFEVFWQSYFPNYRENIAIGLTTVGHSESLPKTTEMQGLWNKNLAALFKGTLMQI